jgi:dsDNA-specific endonuclease/ATPase MutS2
MDTKLTLKLNGQIIEQAKIYAKAKNTSLSSLIENYLQKLTDPKKKKENITPLVKSLSGVIKLTGDQSNKKDYADYLAKKYK